MRERTTSNAWVSALVLVLLLLAPLLYVLSVGPVAWLASHGYISSDDENSPLVLFYRPLTWLHESVPMASESLDWYVSLWSK